MRAMLDTNLWSSLGDDGSVKEFERFLIKHDLELVIPPSTLVEVIDIPHEEARSRIIQVMGRGPRRTRLRTEADFFGAEIVAVMRRTRPEWLHVISNPAAIARYRNFWLKGIWAQALVDSTSLHEYQAQHKHVHDHVVSRQRTNKGEMLNNKFTMGPLDGLIGEAAAGLQTGVPEWSGEAAAAWRLNLAQLTWHQLAVIGPRASVTGEDRTLTDWVAPYVNVARVKLEAARFTSMWLDEAQIEEVPRNWLNWAVDMVQLTRKIGTGNPADAQHASYLLECELFLSADVRFLETLERIRHDSPFAFASTMVVSGDRDIATAERISAAFT